MKSFSLKVLRKIYKTFQYESTTTSSLEFDFCGQAASDFIKESIGKGIPLMAARLGNVEMHIVVPYYLKTRYKTIQLIDKYIKCEIGPFWWDEKSRFALSNNAGFFPVENIEMLEKFSDLVLNDIREIDILGSWTPYELTLSELLKQSTKVPMKDLEPYYHFDPWSKILEGKKVLVIYPFEKTIRQQYGKNKYLFKNKDILPDFRLLTLKAIQSIGDNRPKIFEDWFAALDFMKKQITETDFDVALIGAGAYGLSLAAHVKKIGKIGIQLGGATQILFGIKGTRWENHPEISKLFNKYWVRPLGVDTPQGYQNIENGCYW
ncbi:MAG: hypothetical protein GX180_14340 [Enterococcus sp.]|nr:hypothetical protein [Enterococcus sp.]